MKYTGPTFEDLCCETLMTAIDDEQLHTGFTCIWLPLPATVTPYLTRKMVHFCPFCGEKIEVMGEYKGEK